MYDMVFPFYSVVVVCLRGGIPVHVSLDSVVIVSELVCFVDYHQHGE